MCFIKDNKKLVFLFLFFIFVVNSFHCQNLKSDSKFELSLALDIPLCVVGATTFILPHILPESEEIYNPEQIRNLNNVNIFDRWSALPYSKSVDITSDALAFILLACPLSLLATDTHEYLTWSVMYFETLTLGIGIKDLLKYGIYKERPYMYFENKPQKEIDEKNYFSSFPSGHTTMAFLGAAFTSYTFSKYFPESRWKLPIIIGSYSLAGITGTLRILSGSHFFTDVLVGAVIGTTVGIGIPFLHTLNYKINKKIENKNIENLNVTIMPNHLSCIIRY